SGVENLIPIPSESEGIPEHVCDVPSIDNSPPPDVSKDTIEDLSQSNEEFSSTDDDSFSLDNIDYVEASPPDSELVSSEVIVIPEVGGIKASNDNPIPSHDSIISGNPPNLTPSGESEFFSEVDAFLAVEDEFTSSQSSKSDLDPEGDMLLFESFVNDDPSSDSQTKDILIPKDLPSNNSLSFAEIESFPFDIPPFSRPSAKPPDGDTGILNIKMMGDISDQKVFMHKLMITLASHQEKSLDLLSHRCGTVKKFNTHCSHLNTFSMMINGQNNPPLDVLLIVTLMEEIDLFCTLDYQMPPGIEDEDSDSERDILIPKDLPSNNSLSFAEIESFPFDIPPFSRPSAKPPDGDTGILNIKMMGDISDQKVFMHKLMITLASHQEKSLDLLSHRCGTVKKFNTHCSHLNTFSMMINGQNNPPLDVLLFYFYPP
nr:hypothetical protein [Tanacetum cinerariifolium]